jgi:hypothetical protein
MYSGLLRAAFLFVFFALGGAGCASLVAPYDDTFDKGLNQYSDDTAKFLAAVTANGPERNFASKEAATYYASAYNLLDRFQQRASVTRGSIPCPTDESLKTFTALPTSNSPLPADYDKFDCREFQLFAVRLYLDQMSYAHKSGGTLNNSEAKITGDQLQRSIQGAIQTFVVNKPTK